MRAFPCFWSLYAAVALSLLVGCGERSRDMVRLGDATPERRSAFVDAVARACAMYDGLDAPSAKFEATVGDAGCSVAVSCPDIGDAALQNALSTAVTNMAMEYPGLAFIKEDDGTWKVLVSDGILIPATGGFGIGDE